MSSNLCTNLLICLIALPFPALAQVHKWVDDKGGVHYGDQPPSTRQSVRLTIPTNAAAFPAADPECHSIRCQYERMRADRLRDDEERRRELNAGYDQQRRSAQSWSELYSTLAERDRLQRSEWDAFRFGPSPMDVRLQRDRVYSRPPSYGFGGGVIVQRQGSVNRPPSASSGGSRGGSGFGGR